MRVRSVLLTILVFVIVGLGSASAVPAEISHWNSNTFDNLNTITGFSPIEFGIEFNETGDIKWYKDDALVQTNTSVTSANYTTNFTSLGMHTVKAQMENVNGTSVNTTWNIEVVETGDASISLDPSQHNIYVYDGWANLPQIYLAFKDPEKLEYVRQGTYITKWFIIVGSDGSTSYNTTLYINDSTVKELRMTAIYSTSYGHIRGGSKASILINNTVIRGWNLTENRDLKWGEVKPFISIWGNGTINASNSVIYHAYFKWFYDHTPDRIENCTFYESGTALYNYESKYLTAVYNKFINVSKSILDSELFWSYTNFSYNYAKQDEVHASGENVYIGYGSKVIGNDIIFGGWNIAIVHTSSLVRDNKIHYNPENHNGFQPGGKWYPWYFINNTVYDIGTFEGIHFQGAQNGYIINTTIYNCSAALMLQYAKNNYFYNINASSFIGAWGNCYNDYIRKSKINYNIKLYDHRPENYGYFTNFSIIDTRFNNSRIELQFEDNNNPDIWIINSYTETLAPPEVFFIPGSSGEVREYVWLDVLVTDSNGNPIEGANVTVENLNDTNYPALEVLLPPPPPDLYEIPKEPLPMPSIRNLTSVQTLADGHIPKPNYGWSDKVEPAVALMFQKRNISATVSGYTYRIYAGNINKLALGTVNYVDPYGIYTNYTIVKPDSSWYRLKPDGYQNTTQITLESYDTVDIFAKTSDGIAQITIDEYNLPERLTLSVSSSYSNSSVSFNISTGLANYPFSIYRNGTLYDTATTDANGWLNWTYDGGFSTWVFSFEPAWMYLWWNGTSELPANFSGTELYAFAEGDYYAIKVIEDAARKKFSEMSNNASLQVKVVVCGLEPSASYDVKGYWTNGPLIFSKVVNSNTTGCLCYYTTNFADERYTVIEKRTQANWFIVVGIIGGAIAVIAGKPIIKRFRRWIRRA